MALIEVTLNSYRYHVRRLTWQEEVHLTKTAPGRLSESASTPPGALSQITFNSIGMQQILDRAEVCVRRRRLGFPSPRSS